MRFNDLNALVSHVQEGLGLAVLPALEVQHLVKAGALLKVLPDWHLNPLPLYALTINRKQSYKVKAVLKALKDFLPDSNKKKTRRYFDNQTAPVIPPVLPDFICQKYKGLLMNNCL
ncbi:LysR substrate-binding domain-containing protein [Thalassomonas actiniarum]|uniref:LysR substrate-binding domain-containing protein n=1 Tax=Thalassomonas actiniarum TaxID=485447 RepID=A0AAF0C1M3_9GAMM|nr:LysR substrate-binding domain-containing protein [Thalassomonas actiniarum]WDD97103.1 hypothetical protein SG35_017270 [Thalassomonas actiniarum]